MIFESRLKKGDGRIKTGKDPFRTEGFFVFASSKNSDYAAHTVEGSGGEVAVIRGLADSRANHVR